MHGIIPSRWQMEAYFSGRSPPPLPRVNFAENLTPPQLTKVLMIITVHSVHFKLVPISNIFNDTCGHHIMVANENIQSKIGGQHVPRSTLGNILICMNITT